MKHADKIDQVIKALDYEPDTGVLRWRPARNRKKTGSIAGTIHCSGYRQIGIRGIKYYAHRIAWLHTHGCWPKDEIDHINGDKDDNRIANLREATRKQNVANSVKRVHNKSGYKGVSLDRNGNWVVFIRLGGKKCYLGAFRDPEKAHEAYLTAAYKEHGEYAKIEGVNGTD